MEGDGLDDRIPACEEHGEIGDENEGEENEEEEEARLPNEAKGEIGVSSVVSSSFLIL